jgi:hypothetical protein
LSSGATSYQIQRSVDGVLYTSLPPISAASYQDGSVTVGNQYWYQVAASSDGINYSPYTAPQTVVPAPSAELSLMELRLRSQQRADRVQSQFVSLTEWNFFINQSMYELYDLLIDTYEDYFEAPEVYFQSNGQDYSYPLPDGVLTFKDALTNLPVTAAPFYKLLGVDLGINTANNAYVTMNKYNLIDRNRFVYPNSASTIYGVFNLQYRILGNNMRFIPTPSAGQLIRILYIPRLPTLVADTDITTLGYCGWLQYVIIRAAKYALDKEESDTSVLTQELMFLKTRIEESAVNRDAGRPDSISDTRQGNWSDGWGGGRNGSIGGW